MSYFKSEIPNLNHIEKLKQLSDLEKEILWRATQTETVNIVTVVHYLMWFFGILCIPLMLVETFNSFIYTFIVFISMAVGLKHVHQLAERKVNPGILKKFEKYIDLKSSNEIEEIINQNRDQILQEIEEER